MDQRFISTSIRRKLENFLFSVKKYLLDGNIYDEILKNSIFRGKLSSLCKSNSIKLIGTWVESDELKAMSATKPYKWLEIKELLAELAVERVAVAGIILDRSRIGETRLIAWDESAVLEKSLKRSGQNQNDMAMAMTAKYESATLVTADLEMYKKAKFVIEVPVLDWAEFNAECMAYFKYPST